MNSSEQRRIPPWMWGGLIAVLAVVVGLLLLRDQPAEPSAALRFDISAHQEVAPGDVIFEEVGKITPELGMLVALAVGPDGSLYVAGEGAVAVYGRDHKEARRLTLAGTPDCLAVGANGDLFLGMRDHVDVLNARGEPKAAWEDLGEKAYLTSIAVGDADVYVADAGQRVVFRYDLAGKRLGRIGEVDAEREIPGFVVPGPHFDVAFDSLGALWAVNPGRHGLEHYRANGDLVSSWYRPSMGIEGFCGCCNPTHIAFRGNGQLVTVEKGIPRVKLYSPEHTLVGLIADPKVFGVTPEEETTAELGTLIVDLAVDQHDRVLVLDRFLGAVRVFEAKGGAGEAVSGGGVS